MSHPIFDAKRYPFGIQEAFDLYTELFRYHYQAGTIDLIYRICYNDPYEPLIQGAQSSDVWRDALDKLAKYNRLKNLPSALRNKGADPALELILQKAEAYCTPAGIAGPGVSPKMRQIIISDKTLVLDRNDIRDSIHTTLCAADNSTSVLLVRGDTQSGKSHGKHLFELYANANNEKVSYLSGKTIFTLEGLLERLFLSLDSVEPTGQDTTDSAWYSKVCMELLSTKKKLDALYWIVIDDVERMDTRIKGFIDQFVAMMEDQIFREHFRLILLHYPNAIPTSWNDAHFQEVTLKADSIAVNEVKEAFKEWCEKKGVNMLEDRIHEIAQEVIGNADAPLEDGKTPSSRLRRIHRGIIENFSKLLNNPSA
ncbi:MAG: hypothetical protein BGO21_26355 [Dyadobacter sp. 50-39]|uniref:hypothetical protein n=1 Tax=Dyadobacter sp. 50-39 TaxID=1895756 RepID=UPI000966CF88|nr:hypothetical protein [Dyadobacter sp. 50-39]OJV16422.1 MAG: hypothetical protein BGO21_26355 [Dyadobacter sp. 50-39]